MVKSSDYSVDAAITFSRHVTKFEHDDWSHWVTCLWIASRQLSRRWIRHHGPDVAVSAAAAAGISTGIFL